MSASVPPLDSAPTTAAPLLAGRYRLLDPLGQGGMAAVFRAHDVTLSRQVAIKLLPADKLSDADAVARFRREALALARLTHPNIVQAYDSGQDGGQHFLVMELVEGSSLAAVLTREGKVAPTRAADCGHQIARALHYAHASGLVHRDVKPSNLLLTADGAVKLLDLGLARFLQDQLDDKAMTKAGTGMGTPDYCAPEQFRNAHSADPRADVYSLGCTLYHLIAGRVPFPGSSLSEKVQAHESKEPPPLEELCPEVPGGLALAVGRMMAKRPEDRFGSMAEAAEALAPYVAGSSPSFRELRATTTWDGSLLRSNPLRLTRTRRRLRLVLAGACAALVLLAVVGGWLMKGKFHDPEPLAAGSDTEERKTEATASREPTTTPPKKEPGEARQEPNVLTVSKNPAAGGKYRSIAAALENVRPHQTIRIVDDDVYQEAVLFNRNTEHEGVALEAPGGAVLELPAKTPHLIRISNVRGITLRNLRVRGQCETALVFVTGKCSDVTLERIDFGPPTGGGPMAGLEIMDLPASEERVAPTVLVSNCRFVNVFVGIVVSGIVRTQEEYRESVPVRAVAIRDNLFLDCVYGLYMEGEMQQLQVVGNRFRNCIKTACQFEQILPPARDVLIANNTAVDCSLFLRCWDEKVRSRGVRICNNLSLGATYPDALALDSGGHPTKRRGLMDGTRYTNRWTFNHNWREVKVPEKPPAEPDGWIPGGKLDVIKAKIDGVNRDPRSPDFLRPANDSLLAHAGAGQEDPTLPSYVGAVPPPGVAPWDWDRAWRMPKDAALLTVSRLEGAGGKYRTINDALKDAAPWAAVRVLDDQTYEETIRLDDPKKHTGLTFEAPRGATLRIPDSATYLLTIRDVPHVCVRGFTFIDDGVGKEFNRPFAILRGNVSGVVLTHLHMAPAKPMRGIMIQDAGAAPGQPPLRVEQCVIRPKCARSNDGIYVSGGEKGQGSRGILLHGNRIQNSNRGIILLGKVHDVHCAGNLVSNCPQAGLQVENLVPASRGLLFANNTAFDCLSCFRVWDDLPAPEYRAGQVEVVNNLFFDATESDMAACLAVAAPGGDAKPGDGKALSRLWSFRRNGRDFSGVVPQFAILAGEGPVTFRRNDLVAVDTNDLSRTRPVKGSPLASQGAGAKQGDLPAYIGALPPEGEPLWDWDRTWRARRAK